MPGQDLLEKPKTDDGDRDSDGLWHVFCHCDTRRTICGLECSPVLSEPAGDPPDDAPKCAVCLDLELVPCRNCGCITK